MKHLLSSILLVILPINLFGQISCENFEISADFYFSEVYPCDGGMEMTLILILSDLEPTFNDTTISLVNNNNITDTLVIPIEIGGPFDTQGTEGFAYYEFTTPNYTNNYEFQFLLENYPNCDIVFGGTHIPYKSENVVDFICKNTTIEKPIANEKLPTFPSNIMNRSFKGGKIVFDPIDTTFNYYPADGFSGADGFYFWGDKEFVTDNLNYVHPILYRVNILVNEENDHLQIVEAINTNENNNNSPWYELTLSGIPNHIYNINQDTFIYEITSDENGFIFIPLAFGLYHSLFEQSVSNPEDPTDSVYLNELVKSFNYICSESSSIDIDTLSINEDSISIQCNNSSLFWNYCNETERQEINQGDILNLANTCINFIKQYEYTQLNDISEYVDYEYFEYYPLWSNATSQDYLHKPQSVTVKILLEGAYIQNGLMSSVYYDQDLLPASQPFNQAPWYYEGTETLTASAPNVIDWVLVELRKGIPGLSEQNTTTIERKAGILLDNGDIVSLVDLTSPLVFNKVLFGEEYYVAVRHRNHLDVISSIPLLSNNGIIYDFTQDPADAMGTQQVKDLGDGFYGLYAGDFQVDGTIQVTDYDAWTANPAVLNTYAPADANLDGVIQVTDFDAWFDNKAKVGIGEIRF